MRIPLELYLGNPLNGLMAVSDNRVRSAGVAATLVTLK